MPRPRIPGTVSAPKSSLEQYPEHIIAIGMITIEIGNLEVELGGLLGALLHIQQEIGEIVYLTPRAAIARVAVIENVVNATLTEGTDVYKAIAHIVERAKTVIGKRHGLVHELWGVHATSKQVHRM